MLETREPIAYRDAVGGQAGRWFEVLGALTEITGRQKKGPDLDPIKKTTGALGQGGTVTLTSRSTSEDLEETCFILVEKDEEPPTFIGQMPVGADARGRLVKRWDGGDD